MEGPNLFAKRVLVPAVMVSLLFLSLVLVTPASAQDEEPVVVASGMDTGFNKDLEGPPPLKDYDSSPPVMIAARVGSGAVVAAGTAGSCRNNHWNSPDNPYPYFDKLLDVTFQWMVPGATDLLWYQGYGVYNDTTECENIIDNLEALGYMVTGDSTEPIASIALTNYNILIIPQMQLGAVKTGGDPSLLPDTDVQAIVDFVEAGGGLLIMEQADYDGLNFCRVHNKILEALNIDARFQDDQVQDDTNKWGGQIYQPIIDIDTTTDIGSAYESETGESEIGLDSLCSLRIVVDYDVNVRISPSIDVGGGGETLTYEGEIVNIGTESDTYTITVSDELGWSLSVSPDELSLENGESGEVEVSVTVPAGLSGKVADWITLKAVGALGVEDNARSRAINCFPLDEPPYPIAYSEENHFWFSICTQIVESPAVPIMTGIETGFSEDCTPREPWPMLYCKGEYPVVAAAALVGDGRVITAGPACLRNSPVDYYTNPILATREFAPLWSQWLIDWEDPRESKFLYYINDPELYSEIFHTPDKVATWLDDMEDVLGFEVDTQLGGEITPELLEGYDVLQIAELKRPFTSDEKQAIKDWVEGGGGLFLMCQADYGGYGACDYPNGLLEALGVPITFQDDELYDEDSWVIDGAWFPQVYLLDPREANSEFDVWFAPILPIISVSPTWISANDVRAVFTLTIKNEGTMDATFGIEAEETSSEPCGWGIDVKPEAEVEVGSGENAEVIIVVTVQELESITRMDLSVEATALEKTWIKKSKTFAIYGDPDFVPPSSKFESGAKVYHASLGECTVQDAAYGWNGASLVCIVETGTGALKYVPEDELSSTGPTPPPGEEEVPWAIIAAGIVVVVLVIAIAGYWVKKK